MTRAAAVAFALFTAVGGAGCDVGSAGATQDGPDRETGGQSPPAFSGTAMPAAGPAADFVLTDTQGEPYDFLAETRGSLAMLFFGFTNCPDVCPIHMANLAAVLRELPSAISRQVTVVFVTVDPERDTPERVREWLDQFDRDFIGLIGDADEVREIQLGLGMPATVIRKDEAGTPDVGHAAHLMVFSIDRSRRWAYPFGTRQSDWKRDIPRLVETGTPNEDIPTGES